MVSFSREVIGDAPGMNIKDKRYGVLIPLRHSHGLCKFVVRERLQAKMMPMLLSLIAFVRYLSSMNSLNTFWIYLHI